MEGDWKVAVNDISAKGAELFVFVYGTLKPGGRYHQRYCGKALAQALPAVTKGRLYSFTQWGYPAMTAGDDWVKGYLLTFYDTADVCSAVLKQLDDLEGVLDSDVSKLDGSGLDGSGLEESVPEKSVSVEAVEAVESVESASDDSYQRCWQAIFTPSYEPLQSAWVYRMTADQVRQLGGVYLPSGEWPI